MGTKNNPGAFDCYANAEPDEPMFILLGRDPAAAIGIYAWCAARIKAGLNEEEDQQIQDARRCAKACMDEAMRRGKGQKLADVVVHVLTSGLRK